VQREKEKVDGRVAKERERELARLEAEQRKHLERVMREQASGALFFFWLSMDGWHVWLCTGMRSGDGD
jgi:hypothetical protein